MTPRWEHSLVLGRLCVCELYVIRIVDLITPAHQRKLKIKRAQRSNKGLSKGSVFSYPRPHTYPLLGKRG